MIQRTDDGEHIRHLDTRYADYFEVGHNAAGFIIDCGQQADEGAPIFHTRLIVVPVRFRELLDVLHSSLGQYEASYGALPDDLSS